MPSDEASNTVSYPTLGETALARGLVAWSAYRSLRPRRINHSSDFLREVGARPADEGARTTVFEIDAGSAAAGARSTRRGSKTGRPRPPKEDVAPPSARPGSAFRLDAIRFADIAATAHTAEQILAQIAASARRQRPDGPTAYVAPRTPIETTLADLWAETLHLDRVGVFDDFFGLAVAPCRPRCS